jgi:hypothetical protein
MKMSNIHPSTVPVLHYIEIDADRGYSRSILSAGCQHQNTVVISCFGKEKLLHKTQEMLIVQQNRCHCHTLTVPSTAAVSIILSLGVLPHTTLVCRH